MRILVKAGERQIRLLFPTGMLCSRFCMRLWLKAAKMMAKHQDRYLPDRMETVTDDFISKLPEEALFAMCDELMRIKRRHGHWDLVEVKAASGEEVLIRL